MTFRVPGIPAPKGSRIVGMRGDGQPFSRPAHRSEKTWTEAVAVIARAQCRGAGPLHAPYAIDLVFEMPRPDRPKYEHPTRGDIDKLVRAVLDGLTRGGLIVDDRHVTLLRSAKRYAPPGGEGVTVTIAGTESI